MKSSEQYEYIIKSLIFNNWQTIPFYENEHDDKPAYYKYVIYHSPYHTFVFNAKEDSKISDALDYLFKKVMEVS